MPEGVRRSRSIGKRPLPPRDISGHALPGAGGKLEAPGRGRGWWGAASRRRRACESRSGCNRARRPPASLVPTPSLARQDQAFADEQRRQPLALACRVDCDGAEQQHRVRTHPHRPVADGRGKDAVFVARDQAERRPPWAPRRAGGRTTAPRAPGQSTGRKAPRPPTSRRRSSSRRIKLIIEVVLAERISSGLPLAWG
jgi:hypothetical protein